MYMLYLIAIIAISSGIGFFAGSDSLADRRFVREREEIATGLRQQEIMVRALRRAREVDPASFPAPAAGQYAEIPDETVAAALSGGYVFRNISRLFIDSGGNIVGVLTEGPAAIGNGNGLGSIRTGGSGQDAVLDGLVAGHFGQRWAGDTPDSQASERVDTVQKQAWSRQIDARQIEASGLPMFASLADIPVDFQGAGYVRIGQIDRGRTAM